VDQGVEILTGLPAGEPDEDGEYPENSVNFLVKEQLTKLAEQRQAFGTSEKEVAA
jgi:hypothetical protein